MQNVFEGENRLVELVDLGPRIFDDEPTQRFEIVGEASPYQNATYEWL